MLPEICIPDCYSAVAVSIIHSIFIFIITWSWGNQPAKAMPGVWLANHLGRLMKTCRCRLRVLFFWLRKTCCLHQHSPIHDRQLGTGHWPLLQLSAKWKDKFYMHFCGSLPTNGWARSTTDLWDWVAWPLLQVGRHMFPTWLKLIILKEWNMR